MPYVEVSIINVSKKKCQENGEGEGVRTLVGVATGA